jgi:hypothetical protein
MDDFGQGSGEAFDPALVAGSQTLLPDTAQGGGEAMAVTLSVSGTVFVVVSDTAEGSGEAFGASFLITLPVADLAEGTGEALVAALDPGAVDVTVDTAEGSGESFTATLSATGTAVIAVDTAEGGGAALDPELRELTYVVVPDIAEGSGEALDPALARSAPRPPVSLKAVRSVGFDEAELTWTPRGGTGFKVYRSDSQRGAYTLIGSPTAATYSDTSLAVGSNYAYKVTATDGADESAPSAPVFTAGDKGTL